MNSGTGLSAPKPFISKCIPQFFLRAGFCVRLCVFMMLFNEVLQTFRKNTIFGAVQGSTGSTLHHGNSRRFETNLHQVTELKPMQYKMHLPSSSFVRISSTRKGKEGQSARREKTRRKKNCLLLFVCLGREDDGCSASSSLQRQRHRTELIAVTSIMVCKNMQARRNMY